MVLAAELTGTQQVGLVWWGFTLVFTLWALVDVLRRPSWAWQQAGKSKGLWLLLIIVTALACSLGVFVALYYLFLVSPRVRAQQKLGSGVGFPGS